jgi:hypothetical protein
MCRSSPLLQTRKRHMRLELEAAVESMVMMEESQKSGSDKSIVSKQAAIDRTIPIYAT